jgi:hypothetical protein
MMPGAENKTPGVNCPNPVRFGSASEQRDIVLVAQIVDRETGEHIRRRRIAYIEIDEVIRGGGLEHRLELAVPPTIARAGLCHVAVLW